jgi:hypothetical protein
VAASSSWSPALAQERVIGTPWACGSTRAGTFLRAALSGTDGLDVAVVGDSNTGAALSGMWGYHNGICEALLAMGGTPYATSVYPTLLRGTSASTGGWRSWAYLPGAVGGALEDGSAPGPPNPWSSWNCATALVRYGRSEPPSVDGWAYLREGSYASAFDAVYLQADHPLNAAGAGLRLRVRYGEFAGGSGWFRPAVFGADGTATNGTTQSTSSSDPASRAHETAFTATGTEMRASWSGAGSAAPVAVAWQSVYRPVRGWSVTSHAYLSGATAMQVAATVRQGGFGYRAELLRETVERQRAAGGTGRVLLWIHFGINGTIAPASWRSAVRVILDEYRQSWDWLGYPPGDLAAIAFVGVQRNPEDTSNGGSPLGPVREDARDAGYSEPGLTVVNVPALVPYAELAGPPSLYQRFPTDTVHLSGGPGTDTDGYALVSRRIIERAIRHSRCPEDVNDDGAVDGMDLSIVLGGWGVPGWGSGADFNGDDLVDGRDLGAVFGMWGACN